MALSSIHIKGVKPNSEYHNQRKQDLNYVRKDLTHLNQFFNISSISEARLNAEELYKKSVGQKMQAKAEPIREGVLLVENHHTIEDLKNLSKRLEKEFGIKTIQAYIHKDEGHYDKETKVWKSNLHAHMIFDWTDEKGKSLRIGRDGYSNMQTVIADELGMERGISSSKKHLNSIQYKIEQEEKDMERLFDLKRGLPEALNILERGKALKEEIPLFETKIKKWKEQTIQEATEEKNKIVLGFKDEINNLKTEKNLLNQELLNWVETKTLEKKKIIEEMNKEIEKEAEIKRQSLKRGYRSW